MKRRRRRNPAQIDIFHGSDNVQDMPLFSETAIKVRPDTFRPQAPDVQLEFYKPTCPICKDSGEVYTRKQVTVACTCAAGTAHLLSNPAPQENL